MAIIADVAEKLTPGLAPLVFSRDTRILALRPDASTSVAVR